MRGKSGRGGGAAAKSPRPSKSPTSGPMHKYVTQGGEEEGAAMAVEKQQRSKGRQLETKEKKDKKGQVKTTMDNSILSDNRPEQETET